MDKQIRNMKDFLQLYNKITELCFSHCVDNFYNRNVSVDEGLCIDKCLQKFTRVNQKVMNVYVEVQTEITQRRLIEIESMTKEQQAKISSVFGPNENHTESNETVQTNQILQDKISSTVEVLSQDNTQSMSS